MTTTDKVDLKGVDGLKRLLDEARVQAELARMEARDRLEPLVHKVEQLADQVDERFADVRSTREWDELEGSLRNALSSLRRELSDCDELK